MEPGDLGGRAGKGKQLKARALFYTHTPRSLDFLQSGFIEHSYPKLESETRSEAGRVNLAAPENRVSGGSAEVKTAHASRGWGGSKFRVGHVVKSSLPTRTSPRPTEPVPRGELADGVLSGPGQHPEPPVRSSDAENSPAPWPGSSPGWSVFPIRQGRGFDPRSGHVQESANEASLSGATDPCVSL